MEMLFCNLRRETAFGRGTKTYPFYSVFLAVPNMLRVVQQLLFLCHHMLVFREVKRERMHFPPSQRNLISTLHHARHRNLLLCFVGKTAGPSLNITTPRVRTHTFATGCCFCPGLAPSSCFCYYTAATAAVFASPCVDRGAFVKKG